MTKSKGFLYLLISFVLLSLYGCSSFHSQAKVSESNIPTLVEVMPELKPEPEPLNWFEIFTLSTSARNEALKALAIPNNMQDTLLRSMLLCHEAASDEELQEAERLLKSTFISESPEVRHEEYQVRNYLLKLNKVFQTKKLEVSALQEKISKYRRLIKKQQKANKVLENKIEALTDIEHQINLRPDKNILQVSP
jgi:hypothetical protein